MAQLQAAKAAGAPFAGQPIRDLVTVNGVRVTVADGTWGLVRASRTEQIVRVLAEATSREVAERRAEDVVRALDQVV